MWLFKKKAVPETNNTKEVDVVQLWIVKWTSVSHYVGRHYSGKPEFEAFTSKAAAEDFATSLRQAMKLLKSQIGSVTVTENE